jgi:hypothetical protein
MSESIDEGRRFLRHTLATLAYRGGKTLRGAPASFASFKAPGSGRTAGQILSHIDDLMDWTLSIARGAERWADSAALSWSDGEARFFESLKSLDDFLSSGEPLQAPPSRLFQGPIADALTHVGQIAMLRRMAGAPVKGENYFLAGISAGRVGPDQQTPVREFD